MKTKISLKTPNEENSVIWLTLSDGRDVNIKVYAGFTIKSKHWSKKNDCVLSANPDATSINSYLKDLQKQVTDIYLTAKGKGIQPDAKFIRQALDNLKEPPQPEKPAEPLPEKPDFYKAYSQFVEVQKEFRQPLTIKKYNTLFISLKAFQKEKKYSVTFENIDMAFYETYVTYLLKRPNPRYKNRESPLVNDTIAKYISNLKTFMQWALDREYHNNLTFKRFEAKKKTKNEIVTLTETELSQLQNFDFSGNPRLEKVRDVFLFLCYTGQRWGDVESFRTKDLKGEVWEFVSEKTKKKIRVPLVGFSQTAKDVLKKYDFKLPVISEQNFNLYLKEAGKLAGIDTPVEIIRYSGKTKIVRNEPKYDYMSSHMGRRTFVTILLEKGVPVTTIMKITGHADLRTLLKYENTNDDAVTDALLKIGRI